jgi:hypothetical protein
MKRILWISAVAVTVFALTLTQTQRGQGQSTLPKFLSDKEVRDHEETLRATEFANAMASRAKPEVRAVAEAAMRAEAERRARAEEKAPSFMGYELGMLQSDIDKKVVRRIEDAKPGKEFVAYMETTQPSRTWGFSSVSEIQLTFSGFTRYQTGGRDPRDLRGDDVLMKDQYLDSEKEYAVTELRLVGDGKNIVEITVIAAIPVRRADVGTYMNNWMRYAVAMVEQKTGKKPDIVNEKGRFYAKWNAKTYGVAVYHGSPNTMEIKVTMEKQPDAQTIRPAL